MERIIIEGDTVSLLNVQEEKTVSLKDFKEEFSKMVGIRTPILPRDCVFFAAKDQTQVLLIEKEPGRFKVKYKKAEQVSEYEICFPWHYFLLEFSGYAFDEVSIFFRNRPLIGLGDEMYIPPLKNLNTDCRVCLGHELKFSVHGSLQNKVTKVMSYFYQSTFNDDLPQNYNDHMPDEIRRETSQSGSWFTVWERLTRDEIDPCSMSWHKYKEFREIVNDTL